MPTIFHTSELVDFRLLGTVHTNTLKESQKRPGVYITTACNEVAAVGTRAYLRAALRYLPKDLRRGFPVKFNGPITLLRSFH